MARPPPFLACRGHNKDLCHFGCADDASSCTTSRYGGFIISLSEIFHNQNHPAIGVPTFMETPISGKKGPRIAGEPGSRSKVSWNHEPWTVMADYIPLRLGNLDHCLRESADHDDKSCGFLPCGFLPLLTSGMDGMVWSLGSHATTWSAFLIGNSDFESQSIDADYISFTHAAQLSSFEQKGRSSGSLHPELRWSALMAGLSRTKRWKWGNIQNPH